MSADEVLSLTDSQLSQRYPDMRPADVRRLRQGFLDKNEREIQDLSNEIGRFVREKGL